MHRLICDVAISAFQQKPVAGETAATQKPPTQGSPTPSPTTQRSTTHGPTRHYGLDALRVVAICGVVAIHTFGLIVSNRSLRGTPTWWVATAVDLGAIWAVPVFVMISGALNLAPRAHAAGPAAFYRRRLGRILPALIVWHLVYLLGVRLVLRGEHLTTAYVARLFIDAKVFTALYFFWLIVGLYLIAPVLAAFLTGGGRRRTLATAGIALGFTVIVFATPGVTSLAGFPRPMNLTMWTMWWPYVGFFLAGWALHRTVLSTRGIVVTAGVAVAAFVEILWQYGTAPAHRLLQAIAPVSYLGAVVTVAALCVFVAAVSVGARITLSPRAERVLVRLSDASFGVFIVHLLFLELVRHWFPAVAQGRSLPAVAAAYVVVVACSFALSMVVAKIPYLRTVL